MIEAIRPTPLGERWDCEGCGACCSGLLVTLDDRDLRRLREQSWSRRPEFRDVKLTRRSGLRTRVLAQRSDGSCVFRTADHRCRIHEELGADAKPLVCRTFPFHFVPLGNEVTLTLQRCCPAAAADRGRELHDHLEHARKLARLGALSDDSIAPPEISAGRRLDWPGTLRCLEALERVTGDSGIELDHRIRRGLALCRRLEQDPDDVDDRGTMPDGPCSIGPPDVATARMFREIALQHLYQHPSLPRLRFLRGRVRMIRQALAFSRGIGRVPVVVPGQPEKTFESLERPVTGPSRQDLAPIDRYFTSCVVSRQYAVSSEPTGWSVVDQFRSLALLCALSVWMVRLVCRGSTSGARPVIEVVCWVDRAHGSPSLAGRYHRNRVRRLASSGQLDRIVAWYVR